MFVQQPSFLLSCGHEYNTDPNPPAPQPIVPSFLGPALYSHSYVAPPTQSGTTHCSSDLVRPWPSIGRTIFQDTLLYFIIYSCILHYTVIERILVSIHGWISSRTFLHVHTYPLLPAIISLKRLFFSDSDIAICWKCANPSSP